VLVEKPLAASEGARRWVQVSASASVMPRRHLQEPLAERVAGFRADADHHICVAQQTAFGNVYAARVESREVGA
jgi:hypothetical protein